MQGHILEADFFVFNEPLTSFLIATSPEVSESCEITEIAHTRTHAAHLLQAVLKEAFAPTT